MMKEKIYLLKTLRLNRSVYRRPHIFRQAQIEINSTIGKVFPIKLNYIRQYKPSEMVINNKVEYTLTTQLICNLFDKYDNGIEFDYFLLNFGLHWSTLKQEPLYAFELYRMKDALKKCIAKKTNMKIYFIETLPKTPANKIDKQALHRLVQAKA